MERSPSSQPDRSEENIYDSEWNLFLQKELLPLLNRQRLTISRGIIQQGQNLMINKKGVVEKNVNGRHYKLENVAQGMSLEHSSEHFFGPFRLTITKGDRMVVVVVEGGTRGIPKMEVSSNSNDGRMIKHDISGKYCSESYEMVIRKLAECLRDFKEAVSDLREDEEDPSLNDL
jgi:hypothetical protein